MIREWLGRRCLAIRTKREPDFTIGDPKDPYLLRWFVLPRNPIFNVYMHVFMRSDDDRALHDHPWANFSYLVQGTYTEHTITQGGIHKRTVLKAGQWRFRPSGKFAHRVELHNGFCTTLFVTGPRYRQWGFHCKDKGWVHWKDFTKPGAKGQIGRGCE